MKTFKRFEVIKMADLLGTEKQYVMEEMKEKGDRKHSLAFSILHFKTKQKNSGRIGK